MISAGPESLYNWLAMNGARRRRLGVLVGLISLIALLWGIWPAGREQRELEAAPEALQGQGLAAEPARLRLSWPQRMRSGDRGVIQLAVELTGPASQAGERYNRLVEARLELAGLAPEPAGEISAPLLPGEPASLQWTLQPVRAGVYPGTLWVHLRFIPRGEGPASGEVRQVLTAQRLELRSARWLGLGGEQARLGGIAGVIAGLMIFVETFLEGFWQRAPHG